MHLADNKDHKVALLINLLKQEELERVVVFANKRETVQYLSGKLYGDDVPCVWLEGKMQQDKRNTSVERLRNGTVNVLVATDVAARGLDIDDITHVINFDMPRTADVYVHRIGRTGRAGKKGIAISFIEAHDVAIVGKVERYIEQKLKRRVIKGLEPQHKEAKIPSKKKKDPVKMKAKKKAKAKTKKKK